MSTTASSNVKETPPEQEPGVIKFTKEEEEQNKLAVLNIELDIRKRKKIEFNVQKNNK